MSGQTTPAVEVDPVDTFVDLLVAGQPADVQARAPRFKTWIRSLTVADSRRLAPAAAALSSAVTALHRAGVA